MNITAFRLDLEKVQYNEGRASIWFNGKTVSCDRSSSSLKAR
jgi:hypothetical protein